MLIPHYNGYNCQRNSYIYPRLTDKRSCLYYLGRLFSFCLVYYAKVPNFMHDNFWKAVVGGRLYFDDELIKANQMLYDLDPMLKTNGTKGFTDLLYPLAVNDVKTFY